MDRDDGQCFFPYVFDKILIKNKTKQKKHLIERLTGNTE